ncbi:kinesin light chain 1 [Nemania serpens]|nr:kinesin light chain 1 [Nemania serpens]
MRLLQHDDAGNYSFAPDFASDNIPPYAILSHTWGPDEVVFADLAKTQDDWQQKAGYNKIRFCAEQARQHGLQYFWVDTCCIDKSDSTELQTAINSMFRWYHNAKICYVYLSDVSSITAAAGAQDSATPWEMAFRGSRWFTRGWTLQELIAPVTVEFYSREGTWLGDKQSLEFQLRDITRVPASALRGTPLSDFTIAEREAWVRNRQTTIEEDMAYSLLGIFGVYMPLIYGEGRQNAQRRLREEVQKVVKGTRHSDFSVTFSLSDVPQIQHFVAREEELAEMHRTLNSDGSRRVVVLHGLGGIGKTQLAVTYAKRYKDEYSAIFWFNIKDETSIQHSFTKVARQILQQYPDASRLSALDLQQNQEEVVEAVKAWFSLPGNTRWLLVYDNFDDPKLGDSTDGGGIDIGRFLPEAYQGSVIVTTRSSRVDLGHRIQVRKLASIDDGLQILATTSGRDSAQYDVDAKRLVEKLDGLPLAIATAGTYLRRVSVDFANYLRLYEESWAKLHMSTPSLGSYQDRTLCSTWQLSYVRIQEQNPLAAHLLQWWAYFDNEDIWFELLQPSGADGPAWISELANELDFNSVMGILHDYGFVEPHISTSDLIRSRGYSIHACVHSWAAYVLNRDRDVSLARVTVECVAASVPSQDERQFWLLQRRLLSHAIKCCATITDGDHVTVGAFHNLGLLYADQGKLQEAEDMYLRALRGYEKAIGPRDIIKYRPAINTLRNFGALLSAQGKLTEAKTLFEQAYNGLEALLGLSHKDVQLLRSTLLDLDKTLQAKYNNTTGPQKTRRRDMIKNTFYTFLKRKPINNGNV